MSCMVSIEPREIDINGGVMLPATEQPQDVLIRRATQSRTLSSTGVAVFDGGYFESERTIELEFRGVTEADYAGFQRLTRDHSEVTVGLWYGCFLATMSRVSLAGTTATVVILVKERLDI